MDKAPEAFRTISEVADLLETPAHVLRFWESRFPQIKPVKRAGGRRYYRPADVALLGGIRQLLHAEGMTIRGVQKVLRDQGVRHVAALGGDISDLDLDAEDDFAPAPVLGPVLGQVVPMAGLPRQTVAVEPLFPAAPNAAGADVAAPDDAGFAEPVDLVADDVAAAGADLHPVVKARPPEPHQSSPADPSVPREGEGGFIAFSSPRVQRPHARSEEALPTQAVLPFDDLAPAMRSATPPTAPTAVPASAEAGIPVVTPPAPPQSHDDAPHLAGVAARLRALSGPADPATATALAEVHSRLGLLHAQMAEAQRLRR